MASNEGSNEIRNEIFWRNLVIRYWYFVLIFGLLIVGAIIGFILTLDWYMDYSTIGGNGSYTFNDFSMRTAILWVLFLILWILLIVVLPTLVVGGIIVAVIWFAVLPPEVKEEVKIRSKKEEEEEHMKKRGMKHGGSSSGAFGLLTFIGVCIHIAVDGNWQTPFGSLNMRYFLDVWITVFIWALIIVGIPAVIFGIIWFARKYLR